MRTTSVLAFGVAALVLRSTGGVAGRDLPILGVVGVADLSANAMFATASSRGLVSVASVLGSLYPIMTVILARIVLHERLRHVQVVGVGLSAVGVALIAA
jgi:drug/metabolite transporter (DMT)-like permease